VKKIILTPRNIPKSLKYNFSVTHIPGI
jgi:hypothetical protein